MKSEIYSFNVGELKCIAVSDGTFSYAPPLFPPPAIFLCVNAPPEQLGKTLSQQGIDMQQWKEWTSQYTCLLINTGSMKVLVDTGLGSISPTTGKLLPNLKSAGISPDDIDMIVISHAHPDHIGGNTDNDGKLVFPKARWIIGKDEWQFWTSEQAERQLPEHGRVMLINMARKNLLPLKDKIDFVNDGSEIYPGIRVMAAPGHTPGQIALDISSNGEQFMYISDVVLHSLHLTEPQWCAATDAIPETVVRTREKILRKGATEKSLMMAFHFPFPGLGRIIQKENVWQWQPIESS